MRHARLFFAVLLVSVGAALMLTASEPRAATAVWVGVVRHEPITPFFRKTNESCRLIRHAEQ